MMHSAAVVRLGVRRGWYEFVLSLRSPSDVLFYVLFGGGALGYLWANRDIDLGVEELTFPQVVLPGLLAALVMFSIVIAPAYALALEREDGTLLRHRMVPFGLHTYLIGLGTLTIAGVVPLLLVVLGGSALLLDDAVPTTFGRWMAVLATVALSVLATLPLGFVIGSLVRKVQQVTTWGMFPIMLLAWISGVFGPTTGMWTWVTMLARAFPLYWSGHLLRAAFLPGAAAAAEPDGRWQIGLAVVVLVGWAVVGSAIATPLVRRMSRRQSGSAVAEARDRAANAFVN